MTEKKQDNKQSHLTTNEHILVIMQEAINKAKQIQEEAQKKLDKIHTELEQTADSTPYAIKLKSEEKYYLKALREAQTLESSIKQAHSDVQSLPSTEKTTIIDVIVDIKLPKPKEKQSEKIDAELIQKLRGLTPGQNLFLKEQSSEVLKIIKADISYTTLNDKQKISKLRKGLTAYHIGKQQSKTRKERQLSKREREMLNSLSYTRLKDRGPRARA